MGKRDRAGCFAWFVFLVSWDGCEALPRSTTNLSAVCDCGISCSGSLSIKKNGSHTHTKITPNLPSKVCLIWLKYCIV